LKEKRRFVGFVFHAHKASELPLFVVPCLTDVNTKGNCLVGGSLAIGKYIIRFHLDTASDFSGEVDTTQYTLSSYGALELSDKGSIEAVLGVAKATHKISNSHHDEGRICISRSQSE
jgi:hypothetical protein